jgi:hypothetical protein
VTSRSQAVVLLLALAVLVAGAAYAVGKAAGGDDAATNSAQPLEAAESHEAPQLAATPAVPPLRERPQAPSTGSGTAEAPAAEAPVTEAPAAQAPATETPAPAPQPETPAAGE